MKTQRLALFLLLGVLLLCVVRKANAEEVNYKELEQQLRKTWLEYHKTCDHRLDDDQRTLKDALEHIYRVQGKEGEANFIDSAVDSELATAISNIESGASQEFPKTKARLVYYVTKQKSGTLDFSPIGYDCGAFSIVPGSYAYEAASKHVGTLKVGEVKQVSKLPFKPPIDRIVVIDSPEKTEKKK